MATTQEQYDALAPGYYFVRPLGKDTEFRCYVDKTVRPLEVLLSDNAARQLHIPAELFFRMRPQFIRSSG